MSPPAFFPGTRVPASGVGLLDGLFSATNGITLSQVCEITGIEPSTVQNWIKRGYVNKPENRRYNRRHLARIVIINMLRDAMAIEKIARLLSYVNGDLLDTSDDIMDDCEIYQHLCEVILSGDAGRGANLEIIFSKVDQYLEGYTNPRPDAGERLGLALKAIVCAYESTSLKRQAEELTRSI